MPHPFVVEDGFFSFILSLDINELFLVKCIFYWFLVMFYRTLLFLKYFLLGTKCQHFQGLNAAAVTNAIKAMDIL